MGGLKEIGVQRRSITNRRNCTTCPEGFTDLMHPSILFTVMQIYYALDLNAITLDQFHRVFHGLKHICLHCECSWTQRHISWAPSIADMQSLLLQLASTVRNWIHGSAANFLVSARSWQFHCFIESKTDRLRQFCGFAESRRGGGLMHYLHATPRSLIWPFCRLDGAHSAAGGLKMLLGGRTAGHCRLSPALRALPPHSPTGARLQIASLQLELTQPCASDTFSGASCSRAAVRVKAGTVTGQRKQP